MKHRSKVEVWLFAAILYVVGVLAAGGNFWIGGPVLLVLLLIALPQEYVTAPEALRVRAGLTRWAIPYAAITFVGESSLGPVLGKRVAVRMGRDSEILLAPDDPGAFFADVARPAPHLMRRGAALVAGEGGMRPLRALQNLRFSPLVTGGSCQSEPLVRGRRSSRRLGPQSCHGDSGQLPQDRRRLGVFSQPVKRHLQVVIGPINA